MLDWIKEHPYLTGGLVLALIVLWVIIRSRSQAAAAASASSGGTTVAGPSDALSEAELAAGVQVQSAQLAAQAQITQGSQAVNAQQLNDAAQVALGQISGGVANNQTAAQLQLGLAQYGYSPSRSPFGLTVPIGTDGTPATVTPTPTTTVPSTTVGYASTAADQAAQLAAENALVDQAGYSIASSAFSGITPATTGAGSGNPVNVPGVPVYIAGPGGAVQVGSTAPTTIPTSSGMTYGQYWQDVSAQFNTQSTAPQSASAIVAAQTAAEEDYLTNPNSCHNRVC
jgi:hypothetical protein